MRKPLVTAIVAAIIGVGGPFVSNQSVLDAAQPGRQYKVFAPQDAAPAGARLIEAYGRFGLYAVDLPTLGQMQARSSAAQVDPEADMLLFTAQPFDTQTDSLYAPAPFQLREATGPRLQVVQFVGPVKQSWLDELAARNIKPVQYVASNGYIVWTDEDAAARLDGLRAQASWLQYAAPLYGFLKVDPTLSQRLAAAATNEEVDVVVQVYRHADAAATRRHIESLARVSPSNLGPVGNGKVDLNWAPVLDLYDNLRLRVRVTDIVELAELPDVTNVAFWSEPRMLDEKQNLIMAGDFTPNAASMDYLQFLTDLGFSQDPADYPLVDITDSTINEGGTGVTVLNTTDPKLRVGGDPMGASRVEYFNNCSSSASNSVGAVDGHGSLNAGIVIGYDQTSGSPYRDADGHQLGLGVNPFGRVGSTAIFVPGWNISGCGGTDQGVIKSNWDHGARISSNSWGASYPPSTYDASDQDYDIGVRDADPATAGNQELIYIVAAANDGPGAATVSSPGAGKNVITVGASENVRPGWSDGCGVGNSGADNANDIINFSSRGPAPGQRVKPEIVAPGTHIQAGASNYSGYTGSGVCDKYYPTGQTIFAASSGTSHSTPAIAGLASLAWHWIERGGMGAATDTVDMIGGNRAPSPAAMKAWMMAFPRYLTGLYANDTLPSNAQGYGMPIIADMFDTTPKVILDQTEVFDDTGETRTYTWSIADVTKPVRIALAWTDAPGALGTSPQVNNLDLSVELNGETYLGNQFIGAFSSPGGSADTKNNYEAVFLPAGTSGDVTITVTAANIAGDGVPNSGDATDQDFAIVCSNCVQEPSFTLHAATRVAEVCSGDVFSHEVNIGSIQGYMDPVAFSLSNGPVGALATVNPASVVPPGTVMVTVSDSGTVPAGNYVMSLDGVSGSIAKSLDFDLTYFDALPGETNLTSPVDGALNVNQTVTLAWEPVVQAARYRVDVALDPYFDDIVTSITVTTTTWTTPSLDSNTRYYWRVKAINACSVLDEAGTDIFSDDFEGDWTPPAAQGFSFVTVALPGDCAIGTTQHVLWNDDLEGDISGWSHTGTQDSWSVGSTAYSGSKAWQANNFSSVSDQRLTSPAVALPMSLQALTLTYWNQQSIESSSSGCWDGAILEISTDDGANWNQVPDASLMTQPYHGLISTSWSNPLGGKQGWCGNPVAYTRSVVDLDDYAGEIVRFRFRLANDSSVGRPNPAWAIDDLKVAGCAVD